MGEEHEIKGILEETVQEFSQAFLAIAVETPFKAEELAKATDTLVHLIWRDLALRQVDSMLNYYMSKLKYYLSKWPFHRYRLMRARKALVKYRKAFHDCEDFERKFGTPENRVNIIK